jgi:phage baseplate assembly protein W
MAQFNSKNQASRVARRWFTDIDINMKNHPQTGDISLKYDINAIKRSVRNLVSTNLYERPFKPSLGVNLRGMLFELDTAHTLVLENEIKDLIHTFEPRAVVTNIFAHSAGNTLDVTLLFSIVNNSSQTHELDLILERVR